VVKKKKAATPRNKFEARINRQLKRARVIFKYEEERIPYILARHYIPDFIIYTPLGKVYVECKGYLRPEDKSKLRAVKKLNPQVDLRIVFYRPVESYIKWAEKNGFRYAIEKVPREWMNGL
jgi:hypothetical protein